MFFATIWSDTRIKETMAHEFGHVLGLFDAYGYVGIEFLFPEAHQNRAGVNDMMRNSKVVSHAGHTKQWGKVKTCSHLTQNS
ncbi:MAG: hypothetical protein CVU97_03570 [Firmicutes bacterium HGW-Firmicutes-21]|nr:MAG: hypothetical protein CVU97_03570 [Firmicutes bacterium HGW-Firmicutes-21]